MGCHWGLPAPPTPYSRCLANDDRSMTGRRGAARAGAGARAVRSRRERMKRRRLAGDDELKEESVQEVDPYEVAKRTSATI